MHQALRLATLATLLVTSSLVGSSLPAGSAAAGYAEGSAVAASAPPNVFIYHLDDLRDSFPGAIDPLRYMPKAKRWMSSGRRFNNSFAPDPSCCPSRASMMTGRYPHNNGVRNQQDGPKFRSEHSLACYLQRAGYSTYIAGKFLTTWPITELPPCFTRSTIVWGEYVDVDARVDGVPQIAPGYSTTYLGGRGRQYITQALGAGRPFLLYETPQAPHWTNVTQPDGSTVKVAVPDDRYRTAEVASCAGVPEADRSDKPAYLQTMNYTIAQAQVMCTSQMRAIMTADDEFAATMQLLSDRNVLDKTVVILSSDNGYMWGEHGRWEKFVPYEPSIQVPFLIRYPPRIAAGTDGTRIVSLLDVLPTILDAVGVSRPLGAPPLDGESLLRPYSRSQLYGEYYNDPANSNIPSWRMVRTRTTKYVQTYNSTGGIIAREYYNLSNDPAENTNLLGDANAGNDPSSTAVNSMARAISAFATCAGAECIR